MRTDEEILDPYGIEIDSTHLGCVMFREKDMKDAMKEAREEYAAEIIEWYENLTPSQKCTVHDPHAGPGLYELSPRLLVDKFNQRLAAIEAEKERGKGE